MIAKPPETGADADNDVQAAIRAGDISRLTPEMRRAVDRFGWKMARVLGCLGPVGSDVTDMDRYGDPVDTMGDFADK